MKKFFKKFLYILLIAFVIIQFIRPTRNTGNADNANDITQATTVTTDVKSILETSCYDCHSDHTNYPWYTNIQPVGWWMQGHVDDGKKSLNFSQFSKYGITRKMRKFKGISNEIEKDGMPLNSYLWIHGNAKLSEVQKKSVIDWATQNYDALAKMYPDSIPKPKK